MSFFSEVVNSTPEEYDVMTVCLGQTPGYFLFFFNASGYFSSNTFGVSVISSAGIFFNPNTSRMSLPYWNAKTS